jgi:threonine aldolase
MADEPLIDLVSDTATRPTPGMLEAMARAPTGDEQLGEDPSTNALCQRVCELLDKPAAVFLPSGIMSNLIALMVHCAPGDEVICSSHAHIITSEAGGPAVVGGVSTRPIDTPDGIFEADAVKACLGASSARAPRPRLLHLEQTSNRGGGSVWPLEKMDSAAAVAREAGLAVHMDGARLLNAATASGVSAREFSALCDSVWLDLSKGLGAPVGSVLAGSEAFIESAWTWKHRLGGAMRQSGVLAAAGLYALDHHVERLAEDHANARLFAALVGELPGVRLDPAVVQTNLVFLDVSACKYSAPEIARRLREHGVRIGAQGPTRMRAVTHLDVTEAQVRQAADAMAAVLGANA